MKHSDFLRNGEITSAGFCDFAEVDTPTERIDISSAKMYEVKTFGESVSLGLKPKPGDARLLERMFNSEC